MADDRSLRPRELVAVRSGEPTGLAIARELAISSLMSNAAAFAVAAFYGWANPFDNSSSPAHLAGFTLCVVAYCTFFGALSSAPLLSFVFRGRSANQRSAWSCLWLTLQLSWRDMVIATVMAVAFTLLLLVIGVPVVYANIHLFVCLIATVSCVVRMLGKVIRLYRSQIAKQRAAQIAVHPGTQTPRSQRRSTSVAKAWSRGVSKLLAVVLPAAGASIIAVQYIALARHFDFDTPRSYLVFCAGSTLLKTALPAMTKSFIHRKRVRNLRDMFFMLIGSVIHVEIQMRMALRRVSQRAQSLAIYKSSAIINALEITIRVATLAFDFLLLRYKKWKVDFRKNEMQEAAIKVVEHDPKALLATFAELDADYDEWKEEHMRVCAIEVLAEMASEYCSIGLVSIFMLVLQWNDSINLPTSRATSVMDLCLEQLSAWATQVAFEVVTDTVATAIEIRAGIPLLGILREDRVHFMRWVIPVITVHASGLCLASLITFSQKT